MQINEKCTLNKQELSKIKQKALEEHIPIIMDDTLEVISNILEKVKPTKILEIGAAVGYSAICFSEFLQEGGYIDTIERDVERIEEAKVNLWVLRIKYTYMKVMLWKYCQHWMISMM